MKKYTVFVSVILLLLAVGFASAQVNITFRVNTSTAEGFTDSTDVIQVRGGTAPLQWNDTAPAMTCVGGDYWQATITFDVSTVGTTVEYKYGATRLDQTTGATYDWWENHDNRTFVVPASDMTLDLDYISATQPPYTPSDSFDIYFRVNMVANQGFNPATDVVSIVGDFPAPDGAANMWSPGTYQLTRESPTSTYYSYHLKEANPSTAYASNNTVDSVYYRFAIGNDWNNTENITGHGMFPNNENRGTVVRSDTTISWKYWNDTPPGVAGSDSVDVHFYADLTQAINENGFTIGDTLIVRYGYNFTARFEEDTLTNVFLTNFYETTVKVRDIAFGADIQYQYYNVKNGSDYREIFFDFNDPSTSSQEKRKVYVDNPPPTVVEAQDVVNDPVALHRMPRFRNTQSMSTPVLVTYTCDLRPPYYQVLLSGDTIQNIQGQPPTGWVYPGQQDSIFVWGVYMNGPGNGTANWQPWDPTGLAPYRMYDDGTHGDMTAGDSIYSYQHLFSPDSSDIIGQEFKFGIRAGDNEGGNTGYGLNHFQNINESQPQFTIQSDFGSINPNFYWRWDFATHTVGIDNPGDVSVIKTPTLQRNYPNPFNPVTTISFTLPKIMDVQLAVYDVLGRKVRTLIDGKQQVGAHVVQWSGTNDHGVQVGSGIYYYRLKTENYDRTMKMVLVK